MVWAISFFASFIGFFCLVKIQNFKSSWFKSFFYVPARKSITNAVQLGGLPLSMSVVTCVLFFINHPGFDGFFNSHINSVMKYWVVGASIIMAYGYLDDKFELRPIVKLVMQFASVCFFSTMASRVLFHDFSTFAFLIVGFWGMGVVNGSNLLDGLDTLTIKLGMVTLGSYIIIGYNLGSAPIMVVSITTVLPLVAFYFFNKEPAKIHLGEIGGSFVGFMSLLLSSMVFIRFKQMNFGTLDGTTLALMPLCLPMVELGISFLRRIYNRKSPFKGDKFHVHHILKNYHEFGPSQTASIMGGAYFYNMVIAFSITHFVGPKFGFSFLVLSLMAHYIMVGKKFWKTEESMDLSPANLFNSLRKKDVAVINSLEVDEFEIHIIGEAQEDDDAEESMDEVSSENEEDSDHKKAA